MRSYDKSFAVIASVRGFVDAADLATAQEEVDRREADGRNTTVGKVLLEQGKVDAARIQEVEAAMARHAFECPKCLSKSYLLPRQGEKEVRCDKCASPTRRAKSPTTAAMRAVRLPEATDAAPRAPEPAPEPRAAVARDAFDAPLPPPVPIKTDAEKTVLEKLQQVPRPAWIVGAVISLLLAVMPLKYSMKIMGYDTKIRTEILKLKQMQWDVRGKTLEILKRDGLEVKPEEVQVVVYQDIKKDAHIFGFVTVESPSNDLHFQSSQNVSSRDTVENALAVGIPFIDGDKSKVWPDHGGGVGRALRALFFFSLALSFVLAAVKLGGGLGAA